MCPKEELQGAGKEDTACLHLYIFGLFACLLLSCTCRSVCNLESSIGQPKECEMLHLADKTSFLCS